MSETYEALDAELRSATKAWTSLSSEYESRFVSTTPLGSGDISFNLTADATELMNNIQTAKERHHEALRRMMEFRDRQNRK